jgi:rubrerythrin
VKAFAELTEQEILALAISAEEEDARIYADYADGLKDDFPASAQVFTDMAAEENDHRRQLIELHRTKFGEHIPLVRRHDVRGFARHEPLWIVRPLGLDRVRKHAEAMEFEARRFYERAMARTTDAGVRKLLGDLAEAETLHIKLWPRLAPGI